MEELTVSQLTRRIKQTLEPPFDQISVTGEISSYRGPHHSGHVYCTLKDAEAQIRMIVWKGTVQRLRFEISDGLEVTVAGKLDLYPRRGEYSLVASSIEPKGIGGLHLAFKQMVERLEQEGLFDDEHKQPIPAYPWRIGVITSPTGAVVRDIITTARRRNRLVEILVFPAKVQGEGAALEIAHAIEVLNARNAELGLDVLIVGRGGGSLEDLWAFNEEPVARAIYASRIPVVSAVGHEVDTTIADLVADLRAPTPTAAAELVVPELAALNELLSDFRTRLVRGLRHTAELWRERLATLSSRLSALGPSGQLRREQQRLDYLKEGLDANLAHRLALSRERTDALGARLEALSPLAVMHRGYSITLDEAGRVLRNADQLKAGAIVHTRLERGEFRSRVEE